MPSEGLDKYWPLVQQAWELADKSREYVKAANREVSNQEIVDNVFLPSGLVDIEKSQKEGTGNPPRIFLKSPYGLEYRADTKNWIPFRHGEITL